MPRLKQEIKVAPRSKVHTGDSMYMVVSILMPGSEPFEFRYEIPNFVHSVHGFLKTPEGIKAEIDKRMVELYGNAVK